MVCKKCETETENKNKKLMFLSKLYLFSLIAFVASFGLMFLVSEGFMFIIMLIAYLLQVISSIILIIKYPHYKYSKLFLILVVIITIVLVFIVILSIFLVDSTFGSLFDFFNGLIDTWNSNSTQ